MGVEPLAMQRTVGNAAVVRMMDPVQRSSVHDVLRSPGRPMDEPLRQEMEARLGADFSQVRVHDGVAAQRSTAEISARAYTSGNHVVIGNGGADKHTWAHELTHVVQQSSGPVAGTETGDGLKVSDPTDRFEREAERAAARAMSSAPPAHPNARATDRIAPQGHTHEHANAMSAEPPAIQRAGGDGTDAGPSTTTPAGSLHEFLADWMKKSASRLMRRSSALKEIDQAVENWLRHGEKIPGALDVNVTELTAIQTAVDGWQRTKTGSSSRDEAISALRGKVRDALDEVRARQREREDQRQVAARYEVVDRRIEGFAVRNTQGVTVDPVGNKAHRALTDHDDQGHLTEQALVLLDELARERLDDQLKIADEGQVTSKELSNDEIRQIMEQNPNEITNKTRFPELKSYLENKGDETGDYTDTVRSDDKQQVTRKVGETQVTVWWDRTDALREERVQMLTDAISKVQDAGYPMPNLTVHLAKYGRQLTVTPEAVEAVPGTKKSQRAEFIAADNVVTSPEGFGNPLTKGGDRDYFLSTQLEPDGTGTMVHELGHFLHYQQNRGRYHDLSFTGFAQGKYADAKSVSGYGAENPREFVAEVFLGRVYGRDFSDSVMDMYKALGGPMPSAVGPGAAHEGEEESAGG